MAQTLINYWRIAINDFLLCYFLIDGISGFQFVYKDGGSLGECNTTETIILFQCNKNAQWDIYDPDVSRFVDGFIGDNPENECLVKIFLSYLLFPIFSFNSTWWHWITVEPVLLRTQPIHIFASLVNMTFKPSQSMLWFVESLKVLCLQIEIEIAMHGNSMFFYCKNVWSILC